MVARRFGIHTETRSLQQEIYLQALVVSLYRFYMERMSDEGGRAIVEEYLRLEEVRRRRMEEHLSRHRTEAAAPVRRGFALVGRLYGRLTSWMGTRIMLRIMASASRRASRRACALAEQAFRTDRRDLHELAALRARNEGDLRDALTQHLIDTRQASRSCRPP